MPMVDSLTCSTFKGDSIITFYLVGVLSIMADCCRYELCEVGGFILSICTSHFFVNSQSTAAGCRKGRTNHCNQSRIGLLDDLQCVYRT